MVEEVKKANRPPDGYDQVRGQKDFGDNRSYRHANKDSYQNEPPRMSYRDRETQIIMTPTKQVNKETQLRQQ